VQGHRHRGGQDLQDLPISHPEGGLARPQPNHHGTDVLPLMVQGNGLTRSGRATEGRHRHPGDAQAGRWQPQGLAHCLQYPGEGIPVGGATGSVAELFTESDHGLDRVVPVAVEPPVDPALQAVTGRRKPDRDDRGGQQAAPQSGPLVQ
jgi:hypothetical protein